MLHWKSQLEKRIHTRTHTHTPTQCRSTTKDEKASLRHTQSHKQTHTYTHTRGNEEALNKQTKTSDERKTLHTSYFVIACAAEKDRRVQLSNMWWFVSYFSKNNYVNIEKTYSGFCSYRSPFPLTFPKYWKAFERHLKVAPPESSKFNENAYTITQSHTLTSEKQNSLLCQPLQASLKNLGGGGASPRGRLQ